MSATMTTVERETVALREALRTIGNHAVDVHGCTDEWEDYDHSGDPEAVDSWLLVRRMRQEWDTLGAAWDAVVVMLPDDWGLQLTRGALNPAYPGSGGFHATAWQFGSAGGFINTAAALSPIAALEALRAELERREVAK